MPTQFIPGPYDRATPLQVALETVGQAKSLVDQFQESDLKKQLAQSQLAASAAQLQAQQIQNQANQFQQSIVQGPYGQSQRDLSLAMQNAQVGHEQAMTSDIQSQAGMRTAQVVDINSQIAERDAQTQDITAQAKQRAFQTMTEQDQQKAIMDTGSEMFDNLVDQKNPDGTPVYPQYQDPRVRQQFAPQVKTMLAQQLAQAHQQTLQNQFETQRLAQQKQQIDAVKAETESRIGTEQMSTAMNTLFNLAKGGVQNLGAVAAKVAEGTQQPGTVKAVGNALESAIPKPDKAMLDAYLSGDEKAMASTYMRNELGVKDSPDKMVMSSDNTKMVPLYTKYVDTAKARGQVLQQRFNTDQRTATQGGVSMYGTNGVPSKPATGDYLQSDVDGAWYPVFGSLAEAKAKLNSGDAFLIAGSNQGTMRLK